MAISFSRPDSEPSSSTGSFRVVRRGFDPDAVLAALRHLEEEVERLREREAVLEREVVAAHRPTVDVSQLDQDELAALVGEEVSALLRVAREDAALARSRAEDEAVKIVAPAYEEAARVRESVQEEVTYLQRVTAEQVETELSSARGRGLEMVTEAREYREKVLADLAQRRDLARAQIRALVDGRDHLLRAFEVARLAAVDIIVELEQAAPLDDASSADHQAERQAAESAIYDAEMDITPVAGIELPLTSGPVLVTSVDDDEDAVDTEPLAVVHGPDETLVMASAGTDETTVMSAPADCFAVRRSALAPLAESLVKQFKRVVVDEQNDVLTAIRRTEQVTAIAELLPGEDAHVARYSTSALAETADAFVAGAASVGLGSAPASPEMRAAVLTKLAEELVLPMRERLERVIESSQGNRFELSAFVRSAYREWKQRFESLADEILLLAHAHGAYTALPAGALVVWQADPSAPACTEASANAGVIVRVPDEFPSGHQHPPAAPSCRCMIQRLPE